MQVIRRIGEVAAAGLTAVVLVVGGAAPARAVTPQQAKVAIEVAAKAYELYSRYVNGAMTLDEATGKIIDAIEAAQTAIMAHVDAIAAANVRACARSAVIDVADVGSMSPDTLQSFARDATDCVTLAEGLIHAAVDKTVINQLAFTANAVGPIALFARTHAGLTTPALRSTLAALNTTVVTKLTPPCDATPLWGDSSGGFVEVALRCVAFNGQQGHDSVIRRLTAGQPLPRFDYTYATTVAMKNTAYEQAKVVLAALGTVWVAVCCVWPAP